MKRALQICIDLGSSLTKAIYILDGKIHWISQENAVLEERIRDIAGNSCVIEFNGRAWTVGASALDGPQETRTDLKKSLDASLRSLGMLGKVIEQENLTEVNVDLCIFLPEGERRFFQALENNVSKGVYNSTFNGLKPNVTLKRIRVMPEGAGIAAGMPKDEDAIALMWGHKDCSILYVSQGRVIPEKSKTLTGRGMIALIKKCPIMISDELILSELICKESNNNSGLRQAFQNPSELAEARDALKAAKKQVWPRILKELDRFRPLSTAEKIYVTGGSHPVWTAELKKKYGQKLRFFRDELEQMALAFPALAASEKTVLRNRFTDSYLFMKSTELEG